MRDIKDIKLLQEKLGKDIEKLENLIYLSKEGEGVEDIKELIKYIKINKYIKQSEDICGGYFIPLHNIDKDLLKALETWSLEDNIIIKTYPNPYLISQIITILISKEVAKLKNSNYEYQRTLIIALTDFIQQYYDRGNPNKDHDFDKLIKTKKYFILEEGMASANKLTTPSLLHYVYPRAASNNKFNILIFTEKDPQNIIPTNMYNLFSKLFLNRNLKWNTMVDPSRNIRSEIY